MIYFLYLFLFACFSLDGASPEKIESELRNHIHYSNETINTFGHIYIGGHEEAISQATWLYVNQAINYYKETKPICIILELNTPGGEVFPAQKISEALKLLDTKEGIPVVAYINNWAISAGAMLAYSCRFIAVTKDGSMGAAEPVYIDEMGKMESASEKVNSVLRTDFANLARFYGRNPFIAEAMVDKDSIVVMRDGAIIKLDSESQITLTGSNPDKIISPKGKLLTLDPQQLVDYGVANLIVAYNPLEEPSATEKSKGKWSASKMAFFHSPFFKDIPNAVVDSYQMDWKTRFFVFLATPMISSLLLMGVMIGGYMELSQPGLTLPGSIAAICLFLLIISTYSLEIATWLELIFFFTGLILIFVELFLLPTFGLLGFFGIMLFIGGLVGMLVPGIGSVHYISDSHTFNAAGEFVLTRLGWICSSFILSLIIIAFLARYMFPHFYGFQHFVLSGNEQEASKGYSAGNNPIFMPSVGTIGSTLTILRPAGKIVVDEKVFDVISSGEWVNQDEMVEIMKVEGSQIIVRKVQR